MNRTNNNGEIDMNLPRSRGYQRMKENIEDVYVRQKEKQWSDNNITYQSRHNNDNNRQNHKIYRVNRDQYSYENNKNRNTFDQNIYKGKREYDYQRRRGNENGGLYRVNREYSYQNRNRNESVY